MPAPPPPRRHPTVEGLQVNDPCEQEVIDRHRYAMLVESCLRGTYGRTEILFTPVTRRSLHMDMRNCPHCGSHHASMDVQHEQTSYVGKEPEMYVTCPSLHRRIYFSIILDLTLAVKKIYSPQEIAERIGELKFPDTAIAREVGPFVHWSSFIAGAAGALAMWILFGVIL